jgi:hypothetical protein
MLVVGDFELFPRYVGNGKYGKGVKIFVSERPEL